MLSRRFSVIDYNVVPWILVFAKITNYTRVPHLSFLFHFPCYHFILVSSFYQKLDQSHSSSRRLLFPELIVC